MMAYSAAVKYAFGHVPMASSKDEEQYLHEFAQRWGGEEPDAFEHAVLEGEGHDPLFGIFALGSPPYRDMPQVRELLYRSLESTVWQQRWASAIVLGECGDKRALRALLAMLTESLPDSIDALWTPEQGQYENWRILAPILLGELGEPLATPALRTALQHVAHLLKQETWASEDGFAPLALQPADKVTLLVLYEDEIVYTLGRLGAFGALANLHVAEQYLHMWMVHLVMGHLHGRYTWGGITRWRDEPELYSDITYMLLRQYGLTLNEQEQATAAYEQVKHIQLMMRYQEIEYREAKKGGTS